MGKWGCLGVGFAMVLCVGGHAAEPRPVPMATDTAPSSPGDSLGKASTKEDGELDFDHEDTYIDLSDAIRSKQYVHRAILTSLIRDTNRFGVGRFYLSHMMGFNQVWQRGDFYTKFSSGLLGLTAGYLTPWGHGIEIGGELSAVSNIFVSYKYFIRPSKFTLWGVLGAGVGKEIKSVGFADGPPEAQKYNGMGEMAFLSLGLLVPTLEVGFKGEVRLNFYGLDRIIFTSGVGVIVFL